MLISWENKIVLGDREKSAPKSNLRGEGDFYLYEEEPICSSYTSSAPLRQPALASVAQHCTYENDDAPFRTFGGSANGGPDNRYPDLPYLPSLPSSLGGRARIFLAWR